MKEYIVQAFDPKTIDSFDAHNAPELVRCNDCKHSEKVNNIYVCEKDRWYVIAREPDWFCADGVKRE